MRDRWWRKVHTLSNSGTTLPFSYPEILICFPIGSFPPSPTIMPLKRGMFRITFNTPSFRIIRRADFFVGVACASTSSAGAPAPSVLGVSLTLILNVPAPRSFHSLPVKWNSLPLHEN